VIEPTVLVVEADPLIRDIRLQLLEPAGYRVLAAPDGELALAQLRAGGGDLVLLDLMLPDVDGLDASERALLPAVLWRRGSFGSDSDSGSRFAERLLTVVATCRQQEKALLVSLAAAGQAACQGTAPPSPLPGRPG
jgi:CheY-like chemotaxis protein